MYVKRDPIGQSFSSIRVLSCEVIRQEDCFFMLDKKCENAL
jgi:hypothetical protein